MLGRIGMVVLTCSVAVAPGSLVINQFAAAGAQGASSRASSVVDDPAFINGQQWNLAEIQASGAWRYGTGRRITVAVIDSGIDVTHPDLRSKIVGQVSCVGTAGDPRRCHGNAFDADGHGTHVAGIIAAATDNGIGIAGVAPDAHILAIRALTERCGLSTCHAEGAAADVAAGIRWAVYHGADVINLSLGSVSTAPLGSAYRAAVRSAWRHGVVPVVAAGNSEGTESRSLIGLPALTVTALARSGHRADYASDVGTARWGLAAPGGDLGDTGDMGDTGAGKAGSSDNHQASVADDTCAEGTPRGVYSTYPPSVSNTTGYACLTGTSAAAPQVAGAVAILRGMGLSPVDAVGRLLATAQDLGRRGRDPTYGSGALDVAQAARSGFPKGHHCVGPRLGRRAGRVITIPGSAVMKVERTERNRLPVWLVMTMGGLSAGAVTDLAHRYRDRRRGRGAQQREAP